VISRRNFLKSTSALGALVLPNFGIADTLMNSKIEAIKRHSENLDVESLVSDESYWALVRELFQPQEKFINLENGYFSAQPLSTLAEQKSQIDLVNRQNSFYMRRNQVDEYATVKAAIAQFAKIDEDEFVVCRNTTEALDTIIHGYNWQKGDEVIVNHQDYGSMLAAFEQQKRRSGIKLLYTQIPLHPKNDEEIISAFERYITPKTKMLLLTHLINLTGQVLPVKKIMEMAHSHNVEVLMDSAHAFAHLPFEIKETGADYVGTSLHKWLCCPMGLGLLYVNKKHIGKIWPLFGDNEFEENDIRKFEHWGTRPVSALATIPTAINFHNAIGSALKFERLFYLKNYWTTKVKDFKGLKINTPFEKERSAAIANFIIEDMTPNELSNRLFDEFNIFTVAIDTKDVKGVRVTPHLYTSINELDKFVAAIETIVGS